MLTVTALNIVLVVPAVLYAIAIAAIDLRSHRIPNVLTATAVLTAAGVQMYADGVGGLFTALGGLLVGLIVMLPFYLKRAFGAGDVKAMAAIGAFLGPAAAVMAAAFTLIAGALMGLAVLLIHGGLASIESLWQRWMLRLMVMVSTGPGGPAITPAASDAASRRFPYGFAIAAGTLATLWFNGSIPLAIATALGH